MHLVICSHRMKIDFEHQLTSSNMMHDEHIFAQIAKITHQVFKVLIGVHKLLLLMFVDVYGCLM